MQDREEITVVLIRASDFWDSEKYEGLSYEDIDDIIIPVDATREKCENCGKFLTMEEIDNTECYRCGDSW